MCRLTLAVMACIFLVTPVTAVTVNPISFEDLVGKSAVVVLARVIDVRGEFIGGGRGIESIVTVSVLKGFKGVAGETMQFTVPGGRAGRYLNVIPGAPTFSAGDVAVIFLTSRGARLPVTTGLTQGIYRVQRGGSEMMVMPPLIDSGNTRVVRGDLKRKPVSLSTFEASVRAIVDVSPDKR